MRQKYTARQFFGDIFLLILFGGGLFLLDRYAGIFPFYPYISIAILLITIMIINVFVRFTKYSNMEYIVYEYCQNGFNGSFSHRYHIYLNSMVGDDYQLRRVQLALLTAHFGESTAAIEELSHISAKSIHDNQCLALYYRTLICSYLATGNTDKAVKLYEEGRHSIENEIKRSGNPLLLSGQGLYYYHMGDFNRSTAYLNTAKLNLNNKFWVKKHSDSVIKKYIYNDLNEIMLYLAMNYISLGRYGEAKKIIETTKKEAEGIKQHCLKMHIFCLCNDLLNRIKPSMKSQKHQNAFNDPTDKMVYAFSDGAVLEKLQPVDKFGMPTLELGRKTEEIHDINKPEIDTLEVAPKVVVDLDKLLLEQEEKERLEREAAEREAAEKKKPAKRRTPAKKDAADGEAPTAAPAKPRKPRTTKKPPADTAEATADAEPKPKRTRKTTKKSEE